MKMKKILFAAMATAAVCTAAVGMSVFADGTVYISSMGNNLNDGKSPSTALSSFSAAYSALPDGGEIVLLENKSYVAPSSSNAKYTIKGNAADITLTLSSEFTLAGDTAFESVTLAGASVIYANGFDLTVAADVTASSRLDVYGGAKNADVAGDTNIVLLGAKYNKVYGGGYNGKVGGNTNVTLGGNANEGEGIDDSNTATLSPCMVYGGGNNGAVLGKTNVTLDGNAVAQYISGAGTSSGGTATDTNIFIRGGKVMNVYGGSIGVALPVGTTTHITMTGGVAESLFGACNGLSLTGHTFIDLQGGEVTRRVYTGCYNNASRSGLSISYSTDYYVSGTTTLIIRPTSNVNTKNGLSDTSNVGVFCGSRTKSQHDAEQNTVIFADGCYSSKKSVLGEKGDLSFITGLYFKSFEDYTVNASAGGNVYGTTTAGTVKIVPNKGYYGKVGSANYANSTASISAGTTQVSFAVDFAVSGLSAQLSDSGVTVSADITAVNALGKSNPKVIYAAYNESGVLEAQTSFAASTASAASQALDFTPVSGKTYTVKAFIWSSGLNALVEAATVTVTK